MNAVRPRIAIVDYDMGNRRSVEKALEHVGAEASITRDHNELRQADALVLPGVGAFPRGIAKLREHGLHTLLAERVADGVPLLGICLGMQLLFDSSTELGETTAGLGLIGGAVRMIDAGGLRVPHIGWSEVRIERESPLTVDLPAGGAPFYHVHSFVAHPSDPEDVVGTAEYGEQFATIVGRRRVYGTQFHPEKSSRDGLALLTGFVRLAQSVKPSTVYA
jgi:imidazole glycerol-phosphate synthase subunit HisH